MTKTGAYRIIISGGGTGGHIFPAVAIGTAFRERFPDADILFVGAEGKMEMQRVPEAGFKIIGLWISGLQRSLSISNLMFPFKVISSVLKSRKIINDFKPDVVVGVGGYASGPLLYAATSKGIPSLIQEQNSYAGLTNKWLARRVQKICVAYEGMEKFFPKENLTITGNPIRKDITSGNITKAIATSFYGLDATKPVVLVFGGSLGAKTLNESVLAGLAEFQKAGVQVLWQCGRFYYEQMKQQTASLDMTGIVLLEFIKEMDKAYAAADVVISRAGALSISELCVVGKPVIFVPSPNVAEDHQTSNAMALVKNEAAIAIKDIDAREQLVQGVLTLLKDKEKQLILSANIKAMARPEATEDIVDQLAELLGATEDRPFRDIDNVYFLGIGGIGMSALARWFNNQGKKVVGYDLTPTALTDELKKEGIDIHFTDDVALIPESFKADKAKTLVVLTPAIPVDHTEWGYFKAESFDIKKRSEVLGIISKSKFTIAVAGTHGKTTTSSMIAHLLKSAGKPVEAFIGGITANYNSNLLLSDDPESLLVAEADEFDRSFLRLHPNIAVITSVDPDHLDIYGSAEEMIKTYSAFAGQVIPSGSIFLQGKLQQTLILPARRASVNHYGDSFDYRPENVKVVDGQFAFDMVYPDGKISDLRLQVPGFHNVENMTAAIGVALQLGIDEKAIRQGVASYKGVKRRFESILKDDHHVFIDDYAHHPEEIRQFLRSVRELYPSKELTAVFQPHLYTRTRDFADGFAESLSMADEVILLPIYPAREKPIPGVDAEMIASKISHSRKQVISKDELLAWTKSHDPEVLLTIGAGDIDKMVKPLAEILKTKSYAA
ncbi:MAG: UDP-N-acetylmuramate--L-alanine ligase [Imperialibacter sp.]|uniref:UDP-N-acetylmuramate--L-alanine ligase n=1 Tax=Imperialibacter sp. TaxID=2038411 RepID=UPI003A85CD78